MSLYNNNRSATTCHTAHISHEIYELGENPNLSCEIYANRRLLLVF